MIGRTLSHYTIEAPLGEGGMGAVYLARDSKLGRKVAIKVLTPAAGGDRELTARLLREARAASGLNHPNLITIHEVGHAEGTDFIVMEHVEGRSLKDVIPPGGMPIPQALDLARQIVSAVAAAHAANVVHRDLKPGNVVVTPDGRAKVLDFGLARSTAPGDESARTRAAASIGITTPGLILGTVGYMSPEQVQGLPADARSDVFSLGVMVFEMLTGRRPFTGDSDWAVMTSTVSGRAPDVTALRPGTPPALARVVARALATRPEERYPSAVELATALAWRDPTSDGAALRAGPRPASIAGATALVVLAIGMIAWWAVRESRLRWARETAAPQIADHVVHDDLAGAYEIARRALALAPRDSRLQQAWANLTSTAAIRSEPPGAEVTFDDYLRPRGSWVSLGSTPLERVQVPSGFLRWRLTKPGYDTLEVGRGFDLDFRLIQTGTRKAGMVFIPQAPFQFESGGPEVTVPEYWIDRAEVTNRQFKAFVDSGGYRRPEFWRQPFVKDGHARTWQQAMAEFVDATGRPGPSTWDLGGYPEEQADLPVGGVSWYEAAAYAAFAGKQLPSVYQWSRASGSSGVFSEILDASNFSGKGLRPAADAGGLGPFGTVGMAGNLKEWCWNETNQGKRYILGGGWEEPSYAFQDEDAQSPFERRAAYGFRCSHSPERGASLLAAPIASLERDPSTLRPVSDELYRAYLHLYDYDPTPLDPRVESVDEGHPAWRVLRVSVRAAYGNERLPLVLFLPRSVKPPYQTVVFFPGSNAVVRGPSQNLNLRMADFLPRSGRALVYPIYAGTYERRAPGRLGMNELRDVSIQRGKDVRRAVDYLETRPDVDRTRIAYVGLSLGAQLGPVYLAIEPRFRTGVLFAGGFETWDIPPETDPVNFAPRVRTPVLMVNGREDFDLPYATAQVPMFQALGTAAADKRHVVFEGGHITPHPQQAFKVTLDWLDARLGPVK